MSGVINYAENGFWENREAPTESLDRAAQLFDSIEGKIIVEIGTGIHGEMSGNSVIVWANKTRAEKIYCLDLDEKHINDVSTEMKDFKTVIAKKQDGLKFLKDFKGTIDLLYLDFWVFDNNKDLPGTARAKAYLEAYENAKSKLGKSAIILIDDTDHIDPWKQTYIIPEARKDGFQVKYGGRQTLLLRN